MKINLKELEEDKKRNALERMKFVEFWANYIKTHLDKEWSRQQNILIDSQIEKAHSFVKPKSIIQ